MATDKTRQPATDSSAPTLRAQLTAVFIKSDEGGYCGYVEEIPNAITQGETIEEVRENLVEVIQLLVECNRELSDKDIAEENLDVIKQPLGKLEVSQ